MEELTILSRTSLFRGIPLTDLPTLLIGLHPTRRRFGKGEILVQCGESCSCLGILMSGQLEAWRPLPDGSRIPTAQMGPGGVFGDVLAGTGLKSPVTVQMTEPGEVLFFAYEHLLTSNPACPAASRQLLRNLMGSVGSKYFALMDRVELLTLKSLRSKICAYLLQYARQVGADTFSVPHSRASMAEYLGCERSALSRELSRMQKEGLIQTYKSSFKLVDRARIEQLYHHT